MTKFTLDMTDQISNAQAKAKRSLEDDIKRAGDNIAAGLMNSGRYSGKEGLAHEILRKKIEDYVLSDAFADKVDKAIENIADEQAAEAVKVLMNAKSRKALFNATKE